VALALCAASAHRWCESLPDSERVARGHRTDDLIGFKRARRRLLPEGLDDTRQYANNRTEWDHGRLKARLRPMRDL
jgi:transposase-like protein